MFAGRTLSARNREVIFPRFPLRALGLDAFTVGRGGALDVQHVVDLSLFKPRAELGDIPVGTVAQHHRRLKPPRAKLVDHLKRQPPLLDVVHVLGQLRLLAALLVELAVLIPLLRDEQPPIQRARSLVTASVDRHPDLTVTDLPQRPRILPGDTDRHLPELRKPRVIDHPRLRLKLTTHPPHQRSAHRHRIPRRLVDELLQALLIPVPKPRRHGLDRLALPIQH